MKNLLYIYVFFIFGCGFMQTENRTVSTAVNIEDLKLVIRASEDIYDVNDDVKIDVKLVNESGRDLIVNTRMVPNHSSEPYVDRDIDFVVSTSSGEIVRFDGFIHASEVNEDDFAILTPRDFFQKTFNLTSLYKLEKQDNYSVYAVYENQSLPNRDGIIWTGRLISNLITFTIK